MAMAKAYKEFVATVSVVYTENSVLGKKRLFSDDATPISSSN